MIDQSGGNAHYQAIVKTTIDGILVTDEWGFIQSFNPAAERIFGYSSAEVIGFNVKMLTPQLKHDDINPLQAKFHRADITGTVRFEQEVNGLRKDGSLVSLALQIAQWTSGEKRYFTEIVRDVTDRELAEERGRAAEREMHKAKEELERLNRDLEERVLNEVAAREAAQWRALRAERIQALGQLAGGVAHDFNNVLQAVVGAADLLHGHEQLEGSHIGRIADTIARAAHRGALITERLLAFARRSPLKAELVDIGGMLNDVGRLLAQTLGSTITVRVDVESALDHLMVDGGQLETVLINIATNARDAMPDGGVFTLSARRQLVAGPESDENGLIPGRYIRIAGSDTGIGMDEVTVMKAGEPFFTTKPQGKGTGLGLSMAKGFAEQSGGGLKIVSKVGRGTTVSICLPETSRPSEKPVDRRDNDKPRILVVDDDELVRDMMELQLKKAGYLVSLAGDGVEAVASFDAEGADILLTDFSMPGMNGIKLIDNLHGRAPKLPAILLTGYTTEQVSWHPGSPFSLLHKPISQARLLQEVASCLAASRNM